MDYIDNLAEYFAKLSNQEANQVREDLVNIRSAMNFCIRDYKKLCDHYTHGLPKPISNDPSLATCDRILDKYVNLCGVNSFIVTTLMKMAVSVELPKSVIQKEYRESNEKPPAFNQYLIAHVDFKQKKIEKFVYDAILEDDLEKKPANYQRVVRRARYLFKRYMNKLQPKLYKLTNGSSTRIEDAYNVRDINGIVYLPEDIDIRGEYWRTIEYFKILNFDEDMEFIEYPSNGCGGKHEINPDDSGKARELYCLDPWVQILSKAISEALEYVAKKLPGNGTYDQHRFIRNCIRNKWHQNSYILSTDMSKYSDTLLRKWIIAVLNDIGMPVELNCELDKLYSLPVIDSIRGTIWSGTLATYQGQYGDFAMITIVNLLAQCLCYDYVHQEMIYPSESEMKCGNYDNIGNSAVGDDTVMRFKEYDPNIKTVVKAVYNSLGVNINLTKTHELIYGDGFIDFIKRVITSAGLIPYVRFEAFRSNNFDEICNETYRIYRDGMPQREWFEFVDCIFKDKAEWIKRLHYINGGVYRGKIEKSDLLLFQERSKSLKLTYTLKDSDDLRKWLDLFQQNLKEQGLDLCNTALVAYYPDYSVLFEEEMEDYIHLDAEEVSEQIRLNMLNMSTIGFEVDTLECPEIILGLKWSDICEDDSLKYVVDFFDDFNNNAAYRYLTANTKRYKETVFYDMYHCDLTNIELDSDIIRLSHYEISHTDDYVNMQLQSRFDFINRIIHKYYYTCGWSYFPERCWEVDFHDYLQNTVTGEQVRLYSLVRPNCNSRRILRFDEFSSIIKKYHSRCSESDLKSLYSDYSKYMG